VGASTTSYTLDLAFSLSEVLAENTDNNLTSFVYGQGAGPSEVEMSSGGNNNDYWYLPDALASTRALVDNTGASVNTYAYLAFGNLRTSTVNVTIDHLFTGQYTDPETGLINLRARTYDPSTGTFLQRDSYNGINQIPLSQNHYLYTQGDPVNRIDPTGYCDMSLWGIGGCAGDFLSGTLNLGSNTGQSIVGGAVDTIKNLANGSGYVLGEVKETAFSLTSGAVDFSKQAVRYTMDHPDIVAGYALDVTVAVGVCGLGAGVVCGGLLLGAMGYVVGNGVTNFAEGKKDWGLLDGINPLDMLLAESVGGITGGLSAENPSFSTLLLKRFAIGQALGESSDAISQISEGRFNLIELESAGFTSGGATSVPLNGFNSVIVTLFTSGIQGTSTYFGGH
jgi:RHS repeat-associated protein